MRGTIDALDELFATLSYDKPRVIALHFKISEGYTLLMLITTFTSCLILCKLRLVKVGFTITAVYTLQLLWLNGEQYILPCLINTIIGCLIASAVPSGCGHSGITGYCVRMPMTLQKPIRK